MLGRGGGVFFKIPLSHFLHPLPIHSNTPSNILMTTSTTIMEEIHQVRHWPRRTDYAAGITSSFSPMALREPDVYHPEHPARAEEEGVRSMEPHPQRRLTSKLLM